VTCVTEENTVQGEQGELKEQEIMLHRDMDEKTLRLEKITDIDKGKDEQGMSPYDAAEEVKKQVRIHNR